MTTRKPGRPKKPISLQVDHDATHWKYASLHEALRDTLGLLAAAIESTSHPSAAATRANRIDTTVSDESDDTEQSS